MCQPELPSTELPSELTNRCYRLIITAELELGALMRVVEQRHDNAIASRAATIWLSELEDINTLSAEPETSFRLCTIRTILRMVKDGFLKNKAGSIEFRSGIAEPTSLVPAE